MGEVVVDTEKLDALIIEAKASGGSELANYQLFILGLCEALGLDRPAMAQEQNDRNDYVFERRVDFKHPDGSRSAGRIDCYRRGCFILEAKQSSKRQALKVDPAQLALIPEDASQRKQGQAKRGTRGWDQVMLAARRQAEDYARALPVEHGYPPFLLVVDVGHVIEVYADFSGQGKNYAHFPDRQSYRIGMDDLHDAKVQARLRTIWTDPQSLDPTRISAEVTRDIAERLAKIAKRLEGEVLEALDDLGEDQARFAMEGETVSPRQFYGLELNPRAVPIADLVLWIGYLKWQLKTAGLSSITEPILHAYGTIRQQDAVIAYDREELSRDAQGRPLSRWDGVTKKLHPITGEEVPDPDAQVPLYSYVNPKRAPWPEVEFIVGNPPFIGGKDMRAELGDGYAEACWAARPSVPGGADFVMHFWDEAATRLLRKPIKGQTNPLRRFGFITTNSITQTFSRRVIERHMATKEPLSLMFAIPNHPWLKASDKAAVRIAMTVAEKGEHEGVLAEVVSEAGLNTDTPQIGLETREGKVRGNLTIGADLASAKALLANELVSSPGVKLHGAGFIVTPSQAKGLGLGTVERLEQHILHYRNGRDIAQRPRGVMVIDLYPMEIDEVRSRFPAVYQHVLDNVKPERDHNNMKFRREMWWWFGATHRELRSFLKGLPRFITTVETTKHRAFQFLDASIRPDNMLINVGLPSAEHLAVLSSRLHVRWALAMGGWLGVGNDPRYSKSRTFDPFPFPLALDPTANDPLHAQQDRLRELGERLDVFRKQRLAEHSFLTMTGLYNALERLRELENDCDVPPLTDAERDVHQAGLVSVLKEIHDDIDRAVLTAYGWDDLIPELVGKPGATLPSPHKSEAQERAEEELLSRLVALNQERAAEEKRGLVRWLRPDYQIPKLGVKAPKPEGEHVGVLDIELPATAERPKWPSDGLEQIRLVRDLLAKAPAPAQPEAIASVFDGRNTAKRRDRIEEVLETLVATGLARSGEHEGQRRYFLPR